MVISRLTPNFSTLAGPVPMVRVLIASMLALSLTACSRLQFVSDGKITIHPMKRNTDTQRIEVEGRRIFYLWGLIPQEYSVNLDGELEQFVGNNVSGVRIEHYQTVSDIVATVASLGFYFPRSYRIIVNRGSWSGGK